MPSNSLHDKVVFITGAGQGIGKIYAQHFARIGAIPVVSDINATNAQLVAEEIKAEGGKALAIVTDVTSEESVRSGIDATVEAYGKINVLINNAAAFSQLERTPFEEITLKEWEMVMRINVTGCFLCAKAVVPHMRDAGWGRIINISSATVQLGLPNFMHYITSKAALIGMTRSLATELGPHGINVNSVLPGLIETGIDDPGGRGKATQDLAIAGQSVKRSGVPEDLTGLLEFLASPESDFITGQSILADGGWRYL